VNSKTLRAAGIVNFSLTKGEVRYTDDSWLYVTAGNIKFLSYKLELAEEENFNVK
jgi:hypothetical protein